MGAGEWDAVLNSTTDSLFIYDLNMLTMPHLRNLSPADPQSFRQKYIWEKVGIMRNSQAIIILQVTPTFSIRWYYQFYLIEKRYLISLADRVCYNCQLHN